MKVQKTAILLALLLLLEIVLRSTEYLPPSNKAEVLKPLKKNNLKILLVGDMAPEQAISAIKPQLTQQQQAGVRFFNLSTPTQNSTQTLRILQQQLATLRPDITVVRTGKNNRTNFYGFWGYTHRNSFYNRLKLNLRQFRILRFVWRMFHPRKATPAPGFATLPPSKQIQQIKPFLPFSKLETQNACFTKGMQLLEKHKHPQAMRFFVQGQTAYPDGFAHLCGQAIVFCQQKRYQQASMVLEKALKKAPTQNKADILNLIAFCHEKTGQPENAAGFFLRAITCAPQNSSSFFGLADIVKTYPKRTGFVKKHLAEMAPKMVLAQKLLYFLDHENTISSWVKHDLILIKKTCRSFGSRLFLVPYPDNPGLNSTAKSLTITPGVKLLHAPLADPLKEQTPRTT